MSGTVLVAFKKNLIGLIRVLDETVGAQVTYADTANVQASTRERIWIGRNSLGYQEPASLSPSRRRDERIEVTVWIETIKSTPELAEDRAITIGRAIEQAIADDPKVLATDTLLWATVVRSVTDTFETDVGSLTQHQLVIEARSRL